MEFKNEKKRQKLMTCPGVDMNYRSQNNLRTKCNLIKNHLLNLGLIEERMNHSDNELY